MADDSRPVKLSDAARIDGGVGQSPKHDSAEKHVSGEAVYVDDILEPTGLLKLAEAQIHENQFDAARQTLQTLNHTEWPSRFSDVESHVRQLEQQLANP